MNLFLLRRYHAKGTNGEVYYNGQLVCKTIELPWRLNRRGVSCIPEGSYQLRRRVTPERGPHVEVLNVRNRSHILFHPGNDVFQDLQGCIAPVSHHVSPGVGSMSREALRCFELLVMPDLEEGKEVWLHVVDEQEF